MQLYSFKHCAGYLLFADETNAAASILALYHHYRERAKLFGAIVSTILKTHKKEFEKFSSGAQHSMDDVLSEIDANPGQAVQLIDSFYVLLKICSIVNPEKAQEIEHTVEQELSMLKTDSDIGKNQQRIDKSPSDMSLACAVMASQSWENWVCSSHFILDLNLQVL